MADIVERLREQAELVPAVPRAPWKAMAEAADEITRLRAQVAALEVDAGRWRYVKSVARQNTAYDYYGNGGLWTIGLHSDDNRLSLDAVADAARKGG